MNILLLFDHYHPYVGGAEIVNRAVAEYLAPRHSVTVLSNGFAGSGPVHQTVNTVPVYRPLRSPRLMHSLTAFCAGGRLAQQADVILCATYQIVGSSSMVYSTCIKHGGEVAIIKRRP